MVLQLWPVYWYSGAYTGMITTALLDNALPVPGLIPLQGVQAVIGALHIQRFFDEMPEAETKAERLLYRIEHGQRRQRHQGRLGVWLQNLVVKIVRIEANDQVGNTQTGEQGGHGLRRVHLIALLLRVIRH